MARKLVAYSVLLTAAAAAAGNYTILPNTRCHNDIGQFHNISAYEDCEGICMAQLAAPLFTYCPNASADGCGEAGGPQPQTCWCFPLDQLNSCEAAAGWTSGYLYTPPPPPVAPPADWAPAIAAGNMAFTYLPPDLIGEGYYPVVANGFLGFETGPYTQAFQNAWPWRDAGSLKLAGVYSGMNYSSPSHRAQIPKLTDVTLVPEAGATYATVGAAVDFAQALYLNRTHVVSGTAACEDTIIEQRTYAHRALRELFVFELRAFSASGSPSWPGCTLPVDWPITPTWLGDTNLSASTPQPGVALWSGTTTVPEEAGLPLRMLAVVFDAWAAGGPTSLTFTPTSPVLSMRAVLRSDVDVPGARSVADVAAAALATWNSYTSGATSDSLLASHVSAMSALWASGGVELAGNASFAATLNASMYDIVSSLRSDLNWSTSPGGLATGGYAGHSFWDMETWMFPVLTVLFPDLARSAAQYRLDRLAASRTNAALSGYDGAMWSWESAYTGLWTAPWRQADTNENHISADIPLAWRRYWYATGDKAWLASTWPALQATCQFWECRFTRADSAGGPPPPGYGPNCSPKDGQANWTVLDVLCPDESSGIVNHSAYTNAAGAQTLAWCVEAAGILGESTPPLWAQIAGAPYLPLNGTLYPAGPVHEEYAGYDGHTINQADVALLQYPVGLTFPPDLAQRDLDYWGSKTDFSGMFTGDTAYACAYLALGNRTSADAQLAYAFNHIQQPFLVFKETAFDSGHTQHFITGSGGYLQAFVFGYSGLRIARLGVLTFASQQPILPPYGVTAVKLRGLHLLGTAFDFQYDAATLCVVVQEGQGAAVVPLELRVLATGAAQPVPVAPAAPVCVPVQAVAVAGVGYA